MKNKLESILEILPEYAKKYVTKQTEEIRIKVNKPIIILNQDSEKILSKVISKADMELFIDSMTKCSIYSFLSDINNGFITLMGGHRVGLCGSVVMENEKITAINDISSINIRVAKEIMGVSERVYNSIVSDDIVSSTLIVSPPACGKTTLLRDLTRQISNNIKGAKVSLIDERGEIAAVYMGEPQNDVGMRTDIYNSYSKKDGIIRAIRSMSPTVIVVDEIGSQNDLENLLLAKKSGVEIVATMHGDENNIDEIASLNIFKYIIFLKKNSEFDRVENIIRYERNQT
jgi:stage III sporulation protein AA